jgi:hypothetical protein
MIAEILDKYIHVNECSDEGGWFAFFTPTGSADNCEMMQDGMYVNGCESAEEAVKELVELACIALSGMRRETDHYETDEEDKFPF